MSVNLVSWAIETAQTLNIAVTFSPALPQSQAIICPVQLSPQTLEVTTATTANPPTSVPLTALEGHDVRLAKTASGGTILVLDGYTYSKNGFIRKGGTRFACSKLLKKCKAFVHVSHDGNILKAETTHNHEPPSFIINENGVIKELTDSCFISRRGGTVVLYGGHQYTLKRHCKSGVINWACVKRKGLSCAGNICVKGNTILRQRRHLSTCTPDYAKNEIAKMFDQCKRQLLSDDLASAAAVYKETVAKIKESGLHLLGEIPTLASLRKLLYRTKQSFERE
ncbi:hypothetical protein evm_005204 [Chilo suppressalis]|nr:hypothetical protein evm_005204 [Chilo suppressalis]